MVEDLQPISAIEKAERVATVFNGFYTITSEVSGEKRVLRIRMNHWTARFQPNKRVVAVLTGADPNRWDHWTSFGFVSDHSISMYPSRIHDRATTSQRTEYEHLARILWSLATDGEWSPWIERGYSLEVVGTCILCNKRLTNEISKRTGIGPFCSGRRRSKKNATAEKELST